MAGKWAYAPDPESQCETFIMAWGNGTCDGTGTETPVTFATENLPDMYDTAYNVLLTAHDAAIDIALKVGSNATTGFIALHANGAPAGFTYLVSGKKK